MAGGAFSAATELAFPGVGPPGRHEPADFLSSAGLISSRERPPPGVRTGHGWPTAYLTSSTATPRASASWTSSPLFLSLPFHGPKGVKPNALLKSAGSAAT